jgi:GT2 family glycosyltransferase
MTAHGPDHGMRAETTSADAARAAVATADLPVLGVAIVSFNSADVILDCLESLLASTGVRLHIAVVDNASTDDTVDCIRAWAAGTSGYAVAGDLPFPLVASAKPVGLVEAAQPVAPPAAPQVLLVRAGVNGGYAAGVNAALSCLAAVPGLDRFWILNPDSVVPPGTARAFAAEPAPAGGFSLMGGRVNYLENPDVIQIDGGLIDWRTGVTSNMNQGASSAASPAPDPARMDFVSGASMVVSRRFWEAAGPMREDYFLYYEEVDWALQRGSLPLTYCPAGIVFHRAGTSIGSASLSRMASPFSIYFKHRNRMRFIRRFRPAARFTAHAFTLAKAAQMVLKGHRHEAAVLVSASFDRDPPAEVRARITGPAASLAFGKAAQR